MRASLAIDFAILASFVAQCTASPVHVFGLRWNGGRLTRTPKEKAPVAVVAPPTLQETHAKVMQESYDQMHRSVLNKLDEYAQGTNLRLKGHPVQHTRAIHEPGVYSNEKYQKAVKNTQDDRESLEATHAKLRNHLARLSDHQGPEQVHNIEEMRKEAHDMHQSMEQAHPLINHHQEDVGAHEEIRKLFGALAKDKPLLRVNPKSTSDIDDRRKQLGEVFRKVPTAYKRL